MLLRQAIEPGYGKWVFRAATSIEAKRSPMRRYGRLRKRSTWRVPWFPSRCLFLPAQSGNHCGLSEPSPGILAAADEALDVRLFNPEAIPWNELAFPSTQEALRQYIGGLPENRAVRFGG